ncbi:hypothetical protein HELRODRAFT_182974 [Helobdella robusta]|uniref:Secreted protein n=1 Tax=Helobdella robusta TaxID=6412 RepID=T1FJ09_HELRO|nr:hypothetical protein HELRODRAFT_182974 [Helobdella robusta]ESN89965.1 hypothetical protein HELRODRAFT_182974 [Helobdella robusta]
MTRFGFFWNVLLTLLGIVQTDSTGGSPMPKLRIFNLLEPILDLFIPASNFISKYSIVSKWEERYPNPALQKISTPNSVHQEIPNFDSKSCLFDFRFRLPKTFFSFCIINLATHFAHPPVAVPDKSQRLLTAIPCP